MKTSNEGIELIKRYEGLRLAAYDDLQPNNPNPSPVKGTLTIGYGHTGPDVYLGKTITAVQAETYLRNDLRTAENAVNALFKKFGWRECQKRFDALVSWVYNTGSGNLSNRSLIQSIKKLNEAENTVTAVWNRHYITSKGVKLNGLIKRRKHESDLFKL